MNKTGRLVIFSFLVVLVAAVSVFSYKSNIWQQDTVVENKRKWVKINDGWSVREDMGNNTNGAITICKIFYPDDVRSMLGSDELRTKTFISTMGEESSDWPVMFFVTHNQNVRMYADSGEGNKLIYSFGNNGVQIVGSESGNAVHCVTLPYVGKKDVIITLQLYPSFESTSLKLNKILYQNSKPKVPVMFFGWRTMCMNNFLLHSFFQAIPIILIYIMGFFALIFTLTAWIIRKIKIKQYLYWGIFALECATGLLFESYIGYFIIENSYLVYFISTVLIALHPYVFLIYIQEKAELSYNQTFVKFFQVLSPVNMLLVCLSSGLTFIPFIIIRYYVCAVLALFIIFMVFTIIHDSVTLGLKFGLLDMTIVFAACCILLDLVIAVFNKDHTNIFLLSKIGMLLFYITCTILITNEVFDDQMLKQRTLILEKSMYTDILTGCRNTAALWRDNKELERERNGFAMSIIHLVNMPAINKTDGKEVGDNALWTVAQLLQNSFAKENVYRMSGTKFCVLMPSNEINSVKEKLEEVEHMLDAYNKKSASLEIKLVSSSGIYNSAEDVDFDGIYIRLMMDLRQKDIQVLS